jgi:branched-chain amino acid transport system substrate-binding protein
VILALLLTACTAAPTAPAETGGEATAPESGEAATEGGEAATTAGPLECTDAIGCIEVAPGEPIRLGYLLSISGATGFLGEDSRGSIEIAIEDRGGELLGHPIELVGEDTLCSAEGGQAAAQKIASDPQVVGIIGTTCSSEAVAGLPIISEAGLSMISPSNTAPSLTNPDPATGGVWMPGYYRTAHNDLFQGKVAADFVFNELGATKLATIHDGSPYADGLQAVAAERFAELGGEVTFQGAVNVGDTDMRPILTELAANPPDVLYFPIFEPEGNLIASQAKEIPGLENTILIGADGLFVDSFPENTGPASVGMYLTGPHVSGGDAYQALLDKWQAKTGGPPPSGYHAHAYDGTNIMLNAVEQAAQVGEDGTLLIGKQAIRDALNATENFSGLTGNLTCSENGDCATGEALAIFKMGEEELNGNWPPPVVWPE